MLHCDTSFAKQEKGGEQAAKVATLPVGDENGGQEPGSPSVGLYIATEIKLHVPSGLRVKVIGGGQRAFGYTSCREAQPRIFGRDSGRLMAPSYCAICDTSPICCCSDRNLSLG